MPSMYIMTESIYKDFAEDFFPIANCSSELLAPTSCQIDFEKIKFQFFWSFLQRTAIFS